MTVQMAMSKQRLKAYLFITLFVWSYLALFASYASVVQAQGPSPNRLIAEPTPGVPAVLLAGQSLSVRVNAESTASGWSTWIYGAKVVEQQIHFLNYTLTLTSQTFSTSEWNLEATVPGSVEAATYSLSVSFVAGGSRQVYRQERSVWILKEWPSTLNFGQLSDTHYPQNPEMTFSGIAYSQLLGADLIVVTGDITDGAAVEQARGVRELLSYAASVPTILIPGNHDRGTTAYDDYIGKRSFSLNIGRFVIIGADTGTDGVLDDASLGQLQKQLDQARGKVILLLIHHPLFRVEGELSGSSAALQASQLYQSWANQPDLARRLLSFVEDYNVAVVISGHVHTDWLLRFSSARTNTVHWFVTTTTIAGPRDEREYNGFRFIQVKADGAVSFPYMPAWAKPSTHPNSIPVSTGWTGGSLYTRWVQGPRQTALTMNMTNLLPELNVQGLLLTNVPSTQPAAAFKQFPDGASGGAAVSVLDIKTIGDRDYFLLRVGLPSKSWVKATVASFEDTTPPTGKIAYTLPLKPSANEPFGLYVEAQDEGWGIFSIYATYVAGVKQNTVYAIPFGNVYRIDLPGFPVNTKTDITVAFVDSAGLKTTAHYILDLSQLTTASQTETQTPPTQPSQPPSQAIEANAIVLVVAVAVLVIALGLVARRRSVKARKERL